MSESVTLLMAMHCHQPVGNFGFVFEEAYEKAYDPFLRVLERHPGVRLALHYSGSLLDWLIAHRPAFLDRVRALVKRGQVEVLSSGYYEPILPVIPEADRQGQLARMRQAIHKRFGITPQGLWLTERVWEPELPATLQQAGIRYTMIDANQFAAAKSWLPSSLQIQDESFWDLLGCYSTDYAGSSVIVFPASKRLRYWMPFQRVEHTIDFLKRLRREKPVAITFADDGEKFGLWPKTYQWVYDEGWLDRFFSALERERAWLSTSTFDDYLKTTGPNGRVALPCGSYEEMLEWSGGYFRNFFVKYPEANAMQQKMVRVSRQLAGLKAQGSRLKGTANIPRTASLQPRAKTREALLDQAEQELYAGQCNCAYWHGVFGGLYLFHLRRSVYEHLLAAEQLVRQAGSEVADVTVADVDGDGRQEAYLCTPSMGVLVDPDEGGTVTEWSLYGPRLNLLDTLSRRYEPYHDKLRAEQAHTVSAGSTPASIHDALGVKEENLASHLVYDDHRRSAFLDYALQSLPSLQDVVRATWGERQLWSSGPFRMEAQSGASRAGGGPLALTMIREHAGGRIRKVVQVDTKRPLLECRYELERLEVPVIGLEFNFSLRDERYLSQAGEQRSAAAFHLEESGSGVSLTLSIDPPATVFHFPIETVSESEAGLERTYQGLCLVCLWTLEGIQSWSGRLRWQAGTR